MKTVLIKRQGALGDVILTTPIVNEFLSQGYAVHVETDCPTVYEGYENVSLQLPQLAPDKIVDLNLAYEKRPKMHIIDAYAMEAFGHSDIDKTTYIIPEEIDYKVPEKTIALHPAMTWRNRTWPELYWEGLCVLLKDFGFNVIAFGGGNDYKLENATNVQGANVHQIAEVLDQCVAFIGSDSGLLHVAGTTTVPMLGLFTCAKAEYRMPVHRGDWAGIYPNLDCYGCLHDEKPPVTFVGCRVGSYPCVTKVSANAVFLTLLELLGVLSENKNPHPDLPYKVMRGKDHMREFKNNQVIPSPAQPSDLG